MGYRDAPEAIEWLCRVFGFHKHAVYPGPGNTILHSELTFGGGMIMIGSVPDGPFRRFTKQPDEIGGAETRHISLIVDDADAVYARAKAAGPAPPKSLHHASAARLRRLRLLISASPAANVALRGDCWV